MKLFTTKRICRAGIIAALYVALTYVFGVLSFQGLFQIRPAEALCILPLFFPEAVPALYIGCMLSNLASPFLIYDVFIGSLATLVAALCTYAAGRIIREQSHKTPVQIGRVALGGIFPVLANAFIIPLIIVFLCGDLSYGTRSASYWTYFASLLLTEAVWVYALGAPLYFLILRLRRKGVAEFLDGKKLPAEQLTDEAGGNDAQAPQNQN